MFRLAIFCLLFFSTAIGFAQDVDCAKAQTQAEINICSGKEFEDADAELNMLWKEIRRVMKRSDEDVPDQFEKGAPALLDAQRAWIDYRDAQCSAERSMYATGSIAPTIANSCATRMTRARIGELKEMVAEY